MGVNVPTLPFCSLWPEGKEVNGDLRHVALGKKKKLDSQSREKQEAFVSKSTQPSIETQSRNLSPYEQGSKNVDVCHYVGKIFRHLINCSIFF